MYALICVCCHNIPTSTPQKGDHGVTQVAKNATIAKMAENCQNCISARPTPPTQTLWIPDLKTLFSLKIKEKPKKLVIFGPKKGGEGVNLFF